MIDLPSAQPTQTDTSNTLKALDCIERRAAIDALMDEFKRTPTMAIRAKHVTEQLPSAEPDLITQMQNGIKATDADDAYSCGMRNGMRWCISLIDDKEPLYENCPSAQQNLQQTCNKLATDLISRQALCVYALNQKDKSVTPNDIMRFPSAQPERTCVNCGRTANNGGWYADGRTRCPIEEHYALPKDGYCHLWEKRNVTDDDYPERRPSIQPDTTTHDSIPAKNGRNDEDRTTDDCISRQAAIELIKNYCENGCDLAEDNWCPSCQREQFIKLLKELPSAQPERTCVNCGRTANNGGWYADGRTRCPIEEHYALPKDGYCHLWEKRNVTDDDYPERRTE